MIDVFTLYVAAGVCLYAGAFLRFGKTHPEKSKEVKKKFSDAPVLAQISAWTFVILAWPMLLFSALAHKK